MASLTQVLEGLTDLATTAVYPNGTSSPSVAGVDTQLYVGWPNPAQLDIDIAVGKAHVSIFKMPGMERNTSRFSKVWQKKSVNTPTLILTVNQTARTVTITGTVSVPQSCVLIINKIAYAYGVQLGNTTSTIAAALAALIPGATALANVITISSGYSIIARVSVAGQSVQELKRQQQAFSVIIWAPSPLIRSLLGDAIEVYLADVERFLLPDSFYAGLIYQRTDENDLLQKVKIYQRKIMYLIEYPTTKTQTDYTIAAVNTDLTVQATPIS